MDLSKFEKYKESEHYIVYLPKDREGKKQIEMIVQYKSNGHFWRTLLSDPLFKLFFEPAEYKKVYMKDGRQRGS